MAEEVRLLLTFAPKLDCVRQCVHRLAVAADKRAAKVDVLEAVVLRLKVCDLADVVAAEVLGTFWYVQVHGESYLTAYSKLRLMSSGANFPRFSPSAPSSCAASVFFLNTFPKLLAIVVLLSPMRPYPPP